MAELTDIAASYALQDAREKARNEYRGGWHQKMDDYDVACALRDLGFVIVKKEPHG